MLRSMRSDAPLGLLFSILVACGAASPPVAPPPAARAPSASPARPADPAGWLTLERDGVALRYQAADDAVAEPLLAMTLAGRRQVEAFFDAAFLAPFQVTVFPDREQLTQHWREAWGYPELDTQCWMVGSGTNQELTLLSPQVWSTQACEHDAADARRAGALITHELVHVYHEQRVPAPGFEGMDELGWFVEGLAVHVSGQLELDYLASATDAIAANKAPERLETAWSGKYKYGVCGSLVALIDRRVGRAKLLELLALRSQAALLEAIGMSEAELLVAWRTEVAGSAPR
jgi:hypothetical protein